MCDHGIPYFGKNRRTYTQQALSTMLDNAGLRRLELLGCFEDKTTTTNYQPANDKQNTRNCATHQKGRRRVIQRYSHTQPLPAARLHKSYTFGIIFVAPKHLRRHNKPNTKNTLLLLLKLFFLLVQVLTINKGFKYCSVMKKRYTWYITTVSSRAPKPVYKN